MPTVDFEKIKQELNYSEADSTKYSRNFKIAKNIKNARIYKGLTQKKLAKLLKTKQESIARWESGRSVPHINTYEKIAIALELPFSEPSINLDNITAGSVTLDNKNGYVMDIEAFAISKSHSKDVIIKKL